MSVKFWKNAAISSIHDKRNGKTKEEEKICIINTKDLTMFLTEASDPVMILYKMNLQNRQFVRELMCVCECVIV